MNKKLNVHELEQEYISTTISYRELAKKHEVSERQVAKYGKELNWKQKRIDYQNEIAVKTQRKFSESISTNRSQGLVKLSKLTDKAIEKVGKLLDEYDDVRNIKDIISAMKDLESLYRGVNGELSLKDAQSYELALKKLEIEKERAGLNEDNDEETGIVLMPAVVDEEPESKVVIEGDENG